MMLKLKIECSVIDDGVGVQSRKLTCVSFPLYLA